MIFQKLNDRGGFTLTEIIVTVIIVGVLASVALPRFTGVFERVKAAEGVQILTALLGAQKVFKVENGSYSAVLANLDVEFDYAENFDVTTIIVQNNINNVASIQRFGGYTLSIDEEGNIGCIDGVITCAKAGY